MQNINLFLSKWYDLPWGYKKIAPNKRGHFIGI